jgi:hypothetical protein
VKNKDVTNPVFGSWRVFSEELGQGFLGFVPVVVAGDSVDLAAVGYAPACAAVSWQVMD